MNFYEAQDFIKKLYPEKVVSFEFDENCVHQIDLIYTDGKLHVINHVEYRKLKVNIQDMDSIYMPIQPHRMLIPSAQIKKKIASDNIYLDPMDLIEINRQVTSGEDISIKINEMAEYSGVPIEQILESAKEISQK